MSPPPTRNMTCPFSGVIKISTGSSRSPIKRFNSFIVRAGMITLTSSGTALSKVPFCTARRNPSAAAMVNVLSSSLTSTPVNTGRDSSVAAAKATRVIADFKTRGSTSAATPSSTVGIGGNSAASVMLMWASELPEDMCSRPEPSSNSRSILSLGREFTNSVSRRAGTVIEPSSSIIAPTHVVIAISRLVADSFSID